MQGARCSVVLQPGRRRSLACYGHACQHLVAVGISKQVVRQLEFERRVALRHLITKYSGQFWRAVHEFTQRYCAAIGKFQGVNHLGTTCIRIRVCACRRMVFDAHLIAPVTVVHQ